MSCIGSIFWAGQPDRKTQHTICSLRQTRRNRRSLLWDADVVRTTSLMTDTYTFTRSDTVSSHGYLVGSTFLHLNWCLSTQCHLATNEQFQRKQRSISNWHESILWFPCIDDELIHWLSSEYENNDRGFFFRGKNNSTWHCIQQTPWTVTAKDTSLRWIIVSHSNFYKILMAVRDCLTISTSYRSRLSINGDSCVLST